MACLDVGGQEDLNGAAIGEKARAGRGPGSRRFARIGKRFLVDNQLPTALARWIGAQGGDL
jgi:hypothetical protein